MLDWLEDDPWFKEKLAQAEARGEARGKARGELKALRKALLNMVRLRFPALSNLAEVKAREIEDSLALKELIDLLVNASDEYAARALLETNPPAYS